MKRHVLLILALVTALAACGRADVAPVDPYDLRCEALCNPLGIDSAQPRFSWKIGAAAPVAAQTAWQVQVASSEKALRSGKADLWDSGKVSSPDQVMVPYAGAALQARQLCWWRVRVWTSDKDASAWSEPQRFGIGIIGDASLQGDYIGAFSDEGRAILFRKTFRVPGKRGTALLRVNSLGYHEVYLNGRKVSDAVLTPAVSQMDKRSLIVTYDVTPFLKRGDNEIVLAAGSGWYKKAPFKAAHEGVLVKAELELAPKEGGQPALLLQTDGTWYAAWSGERDTDTWFSGQYGGQELDARAIPASMASKDLDALEWTKVDVVKVDGIAATPMMCEPCTVQETVTAVRVDAAGENTWVVDMGKGVNALVDITLPALPEGTKVTAGFADHQFEDGHFEESYRNTYIASGNPAGDRFASHFNHQTFRYIILYDLPKAPDPQKVLAHRMRTDYAPAASFVCSDDDLNRIHDMICYTVENLAYDGYMVDCAHIERLGYGGDGNASTVTLQTMFDAAPLYMNWLQAWNDVIRPDGGLPHTAPSPIRAGGGPYWCTFIVQAPWRTYMNYGDVRLLERCYSSMKLWLNYVDAYSRDGLLKPWPETDYRAWYLGDWLAPEGVDVTLPESVDLVSNCALCQSYANLIRIAERLGLPEDAAEYTRRLDALRTRIQEEFYHPETATYGTGSQLDMIYPMLVGVVPEALVPDVERTLFERTATVYNDHLAVGLVGVPVLAEWAALTGKADFVYKMLKQPDYPGYLYMIHNGATCTWENWRPTRSRMHNCFNGIGSWFYQGLGGIVPEDPGYRRVRIAPQTPEGVDWVDVTKETPYGTIAVHWKRTDDGKVRYLFDVPVGVTAVFDGKDCPAGSYDITK